MGRRAGMAIVGTRVSRMFATTQFTDPAARATCPRPRQREMVPGN